MNDFCDTCYSIFSGCTHKLKQCNTCNKSFCIGCTLSIYQNIMYNNNKFMYNYINN